jgi:PAS domain S-box-containing protein
LIHTARPDGYLDFFNRTWLDFVGQPLKSLLGWKWTSWVHPEDIESFVQKWRESLATGERFEGAARVRRADGEYPWMLHINSRCAPEMEEFSSGMDRVLISRTGRGRRNSSEALPRSYKKASFIWPKRNGVFWVDIASEVLYVPRGDTQVLTAVRADIFHSSVGVSRPYILGQFVETDFERIVRTTVRSSVRLG